MATELLALRPMTEQDLDQIMTIEQKAYPFPWTRGIFSDCIRHNYLCWVHESKQQLMAYCVLMLALDELHILNITVDPQYQQQGLGARLLITIEKLGIGLSAKTCFLEVRPSNKAAIHLYLKQGFNEIGVRPDYYPARRGREDAILMAKTLAARA